MNVPENRARGDSKIVQLPVIVFRSRNSEPKPDPVVFTAGGPEQVPSALFPPGKLCGSWTIGILLCSSSVEPNTRGQIWIARGRFGARARFLLGLDVRADRAQELDAAKKCFHRLVDSGIDLAGYNNAEIAQDLVDLRRLLRIKVWNLYGLSYSTWIMMDVMRLDPHGVRSALLESVEPPDVPYDEMGNANLQRSLDVLFDACASDFGCSRSYPDLRSAFAQTVQSLDRQPISITVKDTAGGKYQRPFTGRNAVDVVYSELNDAAVIPHLLRPYTTRPRAIIWPWLPWRKMAYRPTLSAGECGIQFGAPMACPWTIRRL